MDELEKIYKQAEAMSEKEWQDFVDRANKVILTNESTKDPNVTRFQETIDTINFYWKKTPKGFRGHSGEEIFDLFIKDCHPFIFDKNEYHLSTLEEVHEAQDLPFPVISIESIKGYLTVPNTRDICEGYPPTWINCIVAREIAPKEYELLIHGEMLHEDNNRGEVILTISEKDDKRAFAIFNGILKAFLDRIPKEKTGIIPSPFKAKVGSGKGKTFYKPKNIVIISSKKSSINTVPGILGRTIEYTHRFSVRGHWRQIGGLGKNRNGEYCVQGHTWVTEAIKGPKDAPLIKKTYFVEGE